MRYTRVARFARVYCAYRNVFAEHYVAQLTSRFTSLARSADLGRAIVAGLQRHAVTTTFHLRAFCLDHAHRGIEPAALRAAITRRGGIVLDSRLTGEVGVPPTLRRTFEAQWMHLFHADTLARMPEADAGITPQSIVRDLDDAFLRDIRDALHYLADEGFLHRDGDTYRRTAPPDAIAAAAKQAV